MEIGKKAVQCKYTLLAVGTDVEVFLQDQKTQAPVPAIGLIGGTKSEPKEIQVLGKGFSQQEDNVMLEYNIPSAKTSGEFIRDLVKINSYLDELVAKRGLAISIVPSMKFKPEQLKHPQAQEIGCSPDFNVWTRKVNPNPANSPLLKTLRTAGGHVHVSFLVDGGNPGIYAIESLIKNLDVTLGVPSVFLDGDTQRRQLYGRAGAFRTKQYGVAEGAEYRVLSNFWTRTPELMRWLFSGVEDAFWLLNNHCPSRALRDIWSFAKSAIETGDKAQGHMCLSMSNLLHRASLTEYFPGYVPYFTRPK
jgi:hypothetical protein